MIDPPLTCQSSIPTRSELTNSVLMVRPAAFGYSAEAAGSNAFQHVATEPPALVQTHALAEFDAMVDQLRGEGIRVLVADDAPDPPRPDAVFPNNWVSCQPDGTRIVYPMAVASRRAERRSEVLDLLGGGAVDLTDLEADGHYVEGTGSLVFDHANKVAYACRSPRTTEVGVRRVCTTIGYEPMFFDCVLDGQAVYHTNVVLAVTPRVAVWFGAGAGVGRSAIEARLATSGRRVLQITADQVRAFCGNVLALTGAAGPVTVLSETAWAAFTPDQRDQIGRVLIVRVPTIERIGGGGARCMMAEVW